jgi:hypothetical protein
MTEGQIAISGGKFEILRDDELFEGFWGMSDLPLEQCVLQDTFYTT